MTIGILQHVNIKTDDLAATAKFWEEAIGLSDGDRPNFTFPGAWLYSGDDAVMHLIDVKGSDEVALKETGCIDHVAFAAEGFPVYKDRLSSLGYEFEERIVPGGRLWQLFVRDPNGVLCELNFEAAKEQG
jgi:catechol 2,3-dioxygenase-like lactoylglutathione lyase family enzyme